MKITNDPVDLSMLMLMSEADKAYAAAIEAYNQAKARVESEGKRYGGVRDLVTSSLGQSPHSPELCKAMQSQGLDLPTRGRYRFTNMNIGDAVIQALKEHGPATLEELVNILKNGGIEDASPRAVNASLLNAKNIYKREGGKYGYYDSVDFDL